MQNQNQVFTIPHTILLTPSYSLYQYSIYDNKFHNTSSQSDRNVNKSKSVPAILTTMSLLWNGYHSNVYIDDKGMMTHECGDNFIPVHIVNINSSKVNVELKSNEIVAIDF